MTCSKMRLRLGRKLYPVPHSNLSRAAVQVLYDSLMGDPYIAPRIPPRLLDLLEYHRTLIMYDDDYEEDEEFYDDSEEQQVCATVDSQRGT